MKFKKTSFWKAKELIWKSKKKSFYILCLDALFLSVMFLLSRIISPDPYQIYSIEPSIILVFIALYFAFLLFFYSLTKYIVLLVIKSMHEKAEFTLKNYFRFALLNIIIAAIMLVIFFAFSLIAGLAVKQENLALISTILLVAISIIFYFYANIAHLLFIIDNKIGKTIKQAFEILFKRGKVYSPINLNMLVFAVVYTLLGVALALIAGAENLFSHRQIFTAAAGVLFYLVIFFNRVNLFCKIKNI